MGDVKSHTSTMTNRLVSSQTRGIRRSILAMYETANCKLNVSRCKDMLDAEIHIERPLKLNKEIASLEELVSELHRVFSSPRVHVELVSQLMLSYKSDPRHWKKFAKFDRFRYTRNLVDAGNGQFNVMVLCWGPGHASAIHDHADAHCFMKMLKGDLEEVRYKWPERSKPAILKENNNLCDRCRNKNNNGGQNDNCQTDATRDSCQTDVSCDSCQDVDRCHGDYHESDQMIEIGRSRLEENDVCYINDTLGLHRVENPSHVEGAVSLHLYCPPFEACRVFDARTGRATRANVTFWSVGGKRVNKMKEEN